MKIYIYKNCVISSNILLEWFPHLSIEIIKNKKNNKFEINEFDLLISSEESFCDFLEKNSFPKAIYIGKKEPEKNIDWLYYENSPENLKKKLEKIINLNLISQNFQNLQKILPDIMQLAVLGRLTENILHELNNSFQVIFGFAQELVEKIPENKEYKKDVIFIESEIKKSIKVLNSIRTLNKNKNSEEFEDINMISESLEVILESLLNKKNIEIEFKIDPDCDFIQSKGCKLQTILTAILLNVIEQSLEGSQCHLVAKNLEDFLNIEIRFTIDDDAKYQPLFFLAQQHIKDKNFLIEYNQDDCVGVYNLKFKRIK